MEDCDVDADVDVRDPDEKSIMTYVAQFLQYSRDLPVAEEEPQVCITPRLNVLHLSFGSFVADRTDSTNCNHINVTGGCSLEATFRGFSRWKALFPCEHTATAVRPVVSARVREAQAADSRTSWSPLRTGVNRAQTLPPHFTSLTEQAAILVRVASL